jgi:hypothetical protein
MVELGPKLAHGISLGELSRAPKLILARARDNCKQVELGQVLLARARPIYSPRKAIDK